MTSTKRPAHNHGVTSATNAGKSAWAIHPAKQTRSADATRRIAAAGKSLFAMHDYDSVSIAAIAAAAGVSVGGVYTRFPGKQNLVVYLVGELAAELLPRLERELDPARLAKRSLAGLVRRYFVLMADTFLHNRGMLRPAALIARQTHDEQLRELLRRFNTEVHGRFRSLLLERLDHLAHAHAVVRADTAILWSSAAIREVVLYGEPASALSPARKTLIDELTRAVVLYLQDGRDA